MSDKHLERKEVLNLVYTRQAERMADAYARLMADFSQMTAWGRGLESDLSWARAELMQVKAEVERLEHLVNYWRIESECDNARWLRCLEDLEKLRGKPRA
jgi:hypothetical protein